MAKYSGWKGPLFFGEPVPDFVKMMKEWLKSGIEVVVFTARISEDNPNLKLQIIMGLHAWCERHVGQVLEVTNIKSPRATRFYDDRNVCIEKNTGKIIGKCNVE